MIRLKYFLRVSYNISYSDFHIRNVLQNAKQCEFCSLDDRYYNLFLTENLTIGFSLEHICLFHNDDCFIIAVLIFVIYDEINEK